jgi:glycosyltransferase involved in cell wall biosynthesis
VSALSATPLVSCLMVTRPSPERFERFKLSLADYLRQTHAACELVIVLDPRADAPATAAARAQIGALAREDIRIVAPAAAASLGALRNVSVEAARGAILCVWDDDDRHHPERLAQQARALRAGEHEGLCLQHVAHYFAADRRLHVANWIKTPAGGLPSTLMCRRDASIAYPESGPSADLGEDIAPLEQLKGRSGFGLLTDAPHLYVYVYHGGNSWGEAHHRRLASELGLSQGLLRRREAELRAGLAAFDFGRGAITVEGRAGPAFVIG